MRRHDHPRTVPQKRANNNARQRRLNSWMPHFAAMSRARTHSYQAGGILTSIAAALGRQMGRSRA